MIRWGRLAFLLTPLVLIWAGAHFFLDRAIKNTIQSVGSAAVGARVDVGDVHTRFWDLSATLSDLAVTDPEKPMTNAVEIGSLRLEMRLKPLFWKKLIVDDAEITGIRTGTPRKTSGALPKKPSSEKEEPSVIVEKAKDAGRAGLENLKDAYSPKELAAPERLASYQKALAERDRLTRLADQWKSRVQTIDADRLSKRAQEFIDKVKHEKFSGVEGMAKAQSFLKEGNSLKSDLSAAKKELRGLVSDLGKEVAGAKEALKEIDRLRQQDVDRILSQVKSGLSVEGVTKGLLGPAWFAKWETALTWIGKIRRLIDSDKKEESSEPATRRTGRDIVFPFHHRWPTFHLVRASLSGETPGSLAYKGVLSNVSSDPKWLGEPIVLELAGASGARTLTASASMDFTTETPRGLVKIAYAGLPLSGMGLGSLGGGPVTVSGGRGRVETNAAVHGDRLSGFLNLHASDLKLDLPPPDKQDRLARAVDSLLRRIAEATVGVELSGTLEAPRFAVNSSVDDQLRGALKEVLNEQTAQLRADLEKQINGLVKGETEKLSTLVEKNGGSALEKLNVGDKELGDIQEKINRALDDFAGRGLKSLQIPELKKLFKKK